MGTSAERWNLDAVRFWKEQIDETGRRHAAIVITSEPRLKERKNGWSKATVKETVAFHRFPSAQ